MGWASSLGEFMGGAALCSAAERLGLRTKIRAQLCEGRQAPALGPQFPCVQSLQPLPAPLPPPSKP